jgi:ABC-2 type transport system ATP-binding protein
MNFPKIHAPKHLIAISCLNDDVEKEVVAVLINENINFKRSNNDIEIMSINAKARFYSQLEGGVSNE